MQIRSIFSYQYPIQQGSCTAGVALFTLCAGRLRRTCTNLPSAPIDVHCHFAALGGRSPPLGSPYGRAGTAQP